MATSMFKIKKWGAGFMMAFLPAITFLIMIISTDLIQALAGLALMIPISLAIGFKLMSHPIMQYLEGKGLLALTIDSTGKIDSFIVNVKNPYLEGQFRGKKVETVFDRSTMPYLSHPKKISGGFRDKDENTEQLILEIPKANRGDHMFGFESFPVLIYNKNLEQFVSKDALMTFEKETFVEHMVLYLNRKTEDVTTHLRDFGRYIVEQLKPKKIGFGAGIFKWILLFAVILILTLLIVPYLLDTYTGVAAPIASTGPSIISPLLG